MTVSLAGVFIFLVSVYYALTNVKLSVRDVLPGAIAASLLLEASFQAIPIYLRFVRHLPAQAIGGPAILLVWLYVMANVIVLGAEINWALAAPSVIRRRADPRRETMRPPALATEAFEA